MTEKIQKFLSNLGYGSRRSIEKLIHCKSIAIDGKTSYLGQRINKKCKEITIQGKIFPIKGVKFNTRVLLYNKPEGEICTRYDPQKRNTVFKKLPILNMNRWISVGRLDINTRGLLLFTNNGMLANQLMHPSYQIEREYYMRIFGKIHKKKINLLQTGIRINNSYFSFNSITRCNPSYPKEKVYNNQWFRGVLKQGKNREIRLMWKAVKCQVNRLIRIRYGNIYLPKNLKIGQYTELNSKMLYELNNLIKNKRHLIVT